MVSPSEYFSSFDVDMYAVPLMGTDFRRESVNLFHSHPVCVCWTFFIVADLFHPQGNLDSSLSRTLYSNMKTV